MQVLYRLENGTLVITRELLQDYKGDVIVVPAPCKGTDNRLRDEILKAAGDRVELEFSQEITNRLLTHYRTRPEVICDPEYRYAACSPPITTRAGRLEASHIIHYSIKPRSIDGNQSVKKEAIIWMGETIPIHCADIGTMVRICSELTEAARLSSIALPMMGLDHLLGRGTFLPAELLDVTAVAETMIQTGALLLRHAKCARHLTFCARDHHQYSALERAAKAYVNS